jgi:phage repressor protein C with HTH and peptisase S24 domain
MRPFLTSGDEVLVDSSAYRKRGPEIGDIVIARHPTQAGLKIIKRVKGVTEQGDYQLEGDNPDPSQNSPSLVPSQLIMGRVTSRFAPAA